MKKHMIVIVATAAVAVVSGCGRQVVGQRRGLGPVEFSPAFAQARTVLEKHDFTINDADEDDGVISSTKYVDKTRLRLVTASATRQVATIRLQKSGGGQVVAYASVVTEERTQAPDALQVTEDTYSSVPNTTPADREGATTRLQNETWRKLRDVIGL